MDQTKVESSPVGEWVEERVGLRSTIRYILDRKIPKGAGWLNTLGSATMVTFILLVVTGIFLAMSYAPTPDNAWDSVQFIQHDVTFGYLIRGIHHWAAGAMVLLVFLHMARVFFTGAYKYPRELTWVVGVFIFLFVMGSSFTGYLLPWDQKAYWATTVGTRLAGSVPFIGDFLFKLMAGGNELGSATLTRFYAFHIVVLPAVIGGLIGAHLYLVIKHGIAAAPAKPKKDK